LQILTISPFLDYSDRIRKRTSRAIDAIPLERYDWTYREGKFTFADLIRHIAAIERWMFAENVAGRPSRYPGHGPELADGPEAVREYMTRMHNEARAIFAALSDEDLQAKCTTPNGTPIAVWKWLRAMIEHEIHHRAQIHTYLSILGLPSPPLYGLTSEEVRERSASGISVD